MTINIYFEPITVHFKPLPEIIVSPQSFVKNITNFTVYNKVCLIGDVIPAIKDLKFLASASSFILSPNIMIPLQGLHVFSAACSSSHLGIAKVINTIFSAAVLGVICKYTYDGTLGKFSNNLYSLSNEAENILVKLKKKDPSQEVTFYEPIQISENLQKMGYIRSIISFINLIFRKVFQFLFSIK